MWYVNVIINCIMRSEFPCNTCCEADHDSHDETLKQIFSLLVAKLQTCETTEYFFQKSINCAISQSDLSDNYSFFRGKSGEVSLWQLQRV